MKTDCHMKALTALALWLHNKFVTELTLPERRALGAILLLLLLGIAARLIRNRL